MRLADLTTPQAWSGAGVDRNLITRYYVTLGYVGGQSHTWQTDGGIDGLLATGVFDITAGAMLASVAGSGVILNNRAEFRSGAMWVRVQAISEQSASRYRSTYTVRLPMSIPQTGQVFIKKEGEWMEITGQGVVIDNAWQWQCLDSTDLFTDWKLVLSDVILLSGVAMVEQLTTTATVRTVQQVVGEFEHALFVVVQERRQWADLTYTWLEKQVNGCRQERIYTRQQFSDCREAKLALMGQLLDRLDQANKFSGDRGRELDTKTGSVLLKRVQALLTAYAC